MTSARRVKGCCPLDCQDGCSWVAHVEDERVVRVEGARDHPFTRGALCAKVNDYPARTYAPDRLLHPLRRTGPKGSGAFKRISWEEALDSIAGRFSAIIEEFGPEALLPLNYLGSLGAVQRRALMRLFHALGTSVFHGSVCGAAGNILDAEGHPRGFDPEELAESRLVLLWGFNPLTTSHHHWHFIEQARRRHGARLVCIDPRKSRTAEKCDEHLAIRPGSDSVLAASMAHVMFQEELFDVAFAERAASDVDAYRASVGPWNPERATRVCGIESSDIVRLAREFATARPATIRCGIAPQQTVNGETFVRSLSALAILAGHWQRPGGGFFLEAYPVFFDQRAARPDLGPDNPRSLDMARLAEHLTSTELDPPLKGLMIWGMNPAVTQPDAGRVQQGLAREDLFTVVLEHFLTDTARYADVVLPSTTQLEHFDLQGSWGHHYISLNQPAVPPQGESKSHGEVMRLLAARLGMTHPALQQSDEEIAASALPDEVSLEALKAQGWYKTSPARPDFRAKLRIAVEVKEPVASPSPRHLQLLTPKGHFFLNSSFGNMSRQRKAMKRPTLAMNHADASERGLHNDQPVLVRNERGELRVWLDVNDSVPPGIVALPGKWWILPDDTSAVTNRLMAPAWSPGGQPAYNEIFVEVSAAS